MIDAYLKTLLLHTSWNFIKQAWGRHFQLCCLPDFHTASLINATSGPGGMWHYNGFEEGTPRSPSTPGIEGMHSAKKKKGLHDGNRTHVWKSVR